MLQLEVKESYGSKAILDGVSLRKRLHHPISAASSLDEMAESFCCYLIQMIGRFVI